MALCVVTNEFRICHGSSRQGASSQSARQEFYHKIPQFSANRKKLVASTTRESNSTGNHKESINISATTITKSAINHKHQKGLKSTLHLPKLEYPCFSQPVNTEGRKYGRGAVNIIGGTGVCPRREGHYPLSRTLPSLASAARPPKCGANRFSCPIFVHLDRYRFSTRAYVISIISFVFLLL